MSVVFLPALSRYSKKKVSPLFCAGEGEGAGERGREGEEGGREGGGSAKTGSRGSTHLRKTQAKLPNTPMDWQVSVT